MENELARLGYVSRSHARTLSTIGRALWIATSSSSPTPRSGKYVPTWYLYRRPVLLGQIHMRLKRQKPIIFREQAQAGRWSGGRLPLVQTVNQCDRRTGQLGRGCGFGKVPSPGSRRPTTMGCDVTRARNADHHSCTLKCLNIRHHSNLRTRRLRRVLSREACWTCMSMATDPASQPALSPDGRAKQYLMQCIQIKSSSHIAQAA